MTIDLNLINEINQTVCEETKEVKAEEIKDKESVLNKNVQTNQKIEQERTVISSNAKEEKSNDLNSPKAGETSFFNKPGGASSLNDFFNQKDKEEKKTTTSTGYNYGYGTSTPAKKEETQQDKAREFANIFTKKTAERAYKEWTHERENERDSWNMFELRAKAEDNRRQTRSLSKEDLKKVQNRDLIKRSLLKAAVNAGKGLIEYLYSR